MDRPDTLAYFPMDYVRRWPRTARRSKSSPPKAPPVR